MGRALSDAIIRDGFAPRRALVRDDPLSSPDQLTLDAQVYRTLIRQNRAKHGLWRLGPDAEQNRVILAAVKNWYCPTSHKVNKQFCSRMAVGWSGVERVQCEACGKWRRLPNGLDGWPRVFYCALNTWDSRFASCEAPEEEWSRDMPMNG